MKPRNIILLVLLLCSTGVMAARKKAAKSAAPVVQVAEVSTERLLNPLSLDVLKPRFSWQIISKESAVVQTAYHVLVSSTEENADNLVGDLWDERRETPASQWITYAGKPLKSRQRCFVRVQVETTKGTSPWSETQIFGIGLRNEADWQGQWIGLTKAMPDEVEDVHSQLASRYLRHEFTLDKPLKCATLYISGLGMYEAFINGQKVSADVLSPQPTDYRRTVIYNAYDVTGLLAKENAIGVVLGNGRYYTMQQGKKPYKILSFGYPTLRANLFVEFQDGTSRTIATNEKWKVTASGAIRSNNEYDGEIYDARQELRGFSLAQYNDNAWMKAVRTAVPMGTLRGAISPNMSVLKRISPVSLITQKTQKTVVDLGQNIAGWLKVRLSNLKRGDTVRIVFAEKLNKDGSLYRDNLRNALSRDIYIASGEENNTWWHPTFVYHGFRYALVEGVSLGKDDVLGEVVSDNLRQTGEFSSGDSILNKVYHNAFWGVLDNYKGLPVDCPQRDERQPWLGDRTKGCFGEAFMLQNGTLYAKWIRDIAEAQREDGVIPDVAPAYWNYYSDNVTWPAALPFAMEMLYKMYGDEAIVRQYYPNVRRWLSHIREYYGKDGLIEKDKYGDWCVPPEDLKQIHSKDPKRQTSGTLISTAYFYRISRLMERFAKLQGKTEDAQMFSSWASQTKEAFNNEFLTKKPNTAKVKGHILYPDSTFYGNNTATANILPLAFGMIDDDYVREEVKKNIIENIITQNKGHISTGVIGTGWLMQTLNNEMQRGDIAWLLATNKTYPSWGYMAQNGATTTWELWNGDTANPAMNSANHVMLLGDLVTWLYEDIAGIRADEEDPAFHHIILRPNFAFDEINHINASFLSLYGKIVSRWEKLGGKLFWHVEIPCNTAATLYFPNGETKKLLSGVYDLEEALPQRDKRILKDEFLYETTSFPECHSATMAEAANGDLVATYFGGTKERNPDVCIWVSRLEKGKQEWTKPQLVADGVLSDTLRKACWNPVVYQMPDKTLRIFFKIGSSVSDWSGWQCSSKDNGKTWSRRMPLEEGFLGPVKNKPVLSKGRIICPTSVEKGGWRLYFELSDDNGKTYWKTDFVPADSGMFAIQPAVVFLPDGRLAALARTRNRHVAVTYSSDNGSTWSKLELLPLFNNNSGLDAVTLSSGSHLLICNDWEIEKDKQKGARTPLTLMISQDGIHYEKLMTIEDSPVSQYSYPSIIETKDHHVHLIYTWRRQRIKHVEIDLSRK